VKILRQLQYLQEFGLTQNIPNCKKLAGTPLWELRILGRDNIRILFASVDKEVTMVLHAFSKKSQKTPAKELGLGVKRYQDVVDK
jgi:phage-related protein